ncbi:inorganic diphosphatase [Nocardia sp. CA-084685]|uniref:inorganic diphosphatase n=1 Tax=Nocardia sp. CA-084685 TaxID=3239970 RepID=UPI003D99D418
MTEPRPLTESGSLSPARQFLGRTVELTIDRPYGSRHPSCGFRYTVNYGFVPGTLAPDGEELDAYFLGPTEPVTAAAGHASRSSTGSTTMTTS